jgi:hypothetical protein
MTRNVTRLRSGFTARGIMKDTSAFRIWLEKLFVSKQGTMYPSMDE